MTEINKTKVERGDTIVIIDMLGEPQYNGKSGTVDHIDSMGQIHCKEFGLAVIPEEDIFKIIKKEKDI
jgi:hypothetical protein